MCKTPRSPSPHSDEEQKSLQSFDQEAAEPLQEKPVNSEEAIPEQDPEQALSDQQEDLEKTQKHGN